MWLKLNLEIVLIFSMRTCFNNVNTLTSNNWNKCKIYNNKINKLIKYFIQKTMKLKII